MLRWGAMRNFPLANTEKSAYSHFMEQTLRENLLDLAASYKDAAGASYASMGQGALNDNTFFSRIQAGKGFTVGTFDRVVAWFSDNWPADLAWPEGIERPVPSSGEAAA